MSTLYIVEPGARLEKEYGRFLVTLHDEVLLRVPVGSVSRVVFVGRVGATTPAFHALLAAGIPLSFISRGGKLLGTLAPPMPGNLPLRQAQYGRDVDPDFCFALAAAIAAGKLRNQRTMAARLARRHDRSDGIAAQLDALVASAQGAADMDTLRGIEGHGARLYFRAYRAAFPADWGFEKRTRRPPRDPLNALLSLGYSLLTQNMMSALEIIGLDPYLGYYHAESYGRPALALDLVEEFRTPVVDSLVLWVVKQRILKPDDFRPSAEKGGIELTDRGLRDFLYQFSRKLESGVMVRELGRRLTYRKLFDLQARRLARVITGDNESYRPFRGR